VTEKSADPMTDNSHDQLGNWLAGYTASYRYRYSWLMLIFPALGLMSVYLARWGSRSFLAVIVAIGAEIIFVMAFLEHKTYYIRVTGDAISRGSCFHSKTIRLSDIDLVQVVHAPMASEAFAYLRRHGRILLKIYWYLDGFDDLIGFTREYARHHNVAFRTRDSGGVWS
jgi:hypothetical protein